jgi:proline iminopeptidase
VTGGNVWYRIVGAEQPGIPLVTLHGGPGFTHDYLEPLEALANERPVVFYDQLGSGKSDKPDDVSLWNIVRFVEELGQVRQGLGLERFHLFGHSWGTMLAQDYMLTKPKEVVSLTLASACSDLPRFARDARLLLQGMPDDVRETIEQNEAAGTFDSEAYQAATFAFYQKHLCRLDPLPEALQRSMAGLNPVVYGTMWGPSEFTISGNLTEYCRTDRLGELGVPVLYLCGRYDEVTPESSAYYQSKTPNSRLVIFENSAHVGMLEESDLYVGELRQFMRDAESQQRVM